MHPGFTSDKFKSKAMFDACGKTAEAENTVKAGTQRAQKPALLLNSFVFIHIDGGGGGSRTPVRKALRHEDYMLSSLQFFSPAALRRSKKRRQLVRWFSPEAYGPK